MRQGKHNLPADASHTYVAGSWLGGYLVSMSFSDGLKRAMDEKSITHDELAQLVGVSRPAVSQWLSGETQPAGKRLDRIAAALGTTVPKLFGEDGEVEHGTVPVIGYVGAGEEVIPFPEDDLGVGLEYVPNPPGGTSDLVAVIVKGASMLPVFWDGDLLFYSREAGFDRSECLYKECVVKLTDGRMFVKHVMPGRTETTFTLTSYNAAPILDADIEWAAPVQYQDRRRRNARTEMKVLVKPKSARRRAR